MPSKCIYDPIHGYMEFNEKCIQIIDHPIFQRMRNIKQLGNCYRIFPGASHNRFEHSLGVGHLANKIISNIAFKQPDMNITQDIINQVTIAGLCHDLGHGPFSHAFDHDVLPALLPSGHILLEHEARSIEYLKIILKEVSTVYSDKDIETIGNLIHPPQKNMGYLYEIVANHRNHVDVDKFDYLKRDPLNVGLQYSFDCERLLMDARVIDNHICYPDKLSHMILHMFSTRYSLHREVYNHRVVKAFDYMTSDLLTAGIPLLFKYESIEQSLLSIPLQWTDNIVEYIRFKLHSKMNHPSKKICPHSLAVQFAEIQTLLHRIDTRKLYTFIGELQMSRDRFKKLQEDELTPDNIESYGFTPKDIIIHNLDMNYGNRENYPLKNVTFYSKTNPDELFTIPKKDLTIILPERFCDINRYYIFAKKNVEQITKFYQTLHESLYV